MKNLNIICLLFINIYKNIIKLKLKTWYFFKKNIVLNNK